MATSESVIRVETDGVALEFRRTDHRQNDRYQCWEAVRPTSATTDHRYLLETFDGGETWSGQLQSRTPNRPGPLTTARGGRGMAGLVKALRAAHRAR